MDPQRRRWETADEWPAENRRFYRRKYSAERAFANFISAVRDQVSPQGLPISLLAIVEETMEPERVTLWLKRNQPWPPKTRQQLPSEPR